MGETPLTRERILEAAEDMLRRHGAAKANVVDVAQALGVSHGSVYRHFPSKVALREAVLRSWLQRVSTPLRKIADGRAAPARRLRDWLGSLRQAKRSKVLDDPELFATYATLATEARDAITEHVAELLEQLGHIIADGMKAGVFAGKPAQANARALAIFDATSRFHHPAMAYLWDRPGEDAAFEQVVTMLLVGLAKPATPGSVGTRNR